MTYHPSWPDELELIQIENRARNPWFNTRETVASDVLRLVALLRRVREEFPYPHVPTEEGAVRDWDI